MYENGILGVNVIPL